MRFELRLAEESDHGARFQLSLRVPATEWQGTAAIVGAGGAVQFQFEGESLPPEWCLSIVRASLRTLFRERAARGGYPSRVTRWRPEPQTPGEEAS